MYLSILRLWNFRKYGTGADNAPGLEVHFHEGVNVLIGENDSGKTTIVDAIRYALKIDKVYDFSGRKQSQMQRGINIVRMKDGTTKKVLVK